MSNASTTTTATITITPCEGDQCSLFVQYAGQSNPQSVFLEMDEDGAVRVDYDGEIGGAVPFDVWHGRALRWHFAGVPTVLHANWMMERCADLLARVHAGHSVEWDGSNNIGTLTADAEAASEEIRQLVELGYDPDCDFVQSWEVDDWCRDGVTVTAATTDAEIETLADGCMDALASNQCVEGGRDAVENYLRDARDRARDADE